MNPLLEVNNQWGGPSRCIILQQLINLINIKKHSNPQRPIIPLLMRTTGQLKQMSRNFPSKRRVIKVKSPYIRAHTHSCFHGNRLCADRCSGLNQFLPITFINIIDKVLDLTCRCRIIKMFWVFCFFTILAANCSLAHLITTLN